MSTDNNLKRLRDGWPTPCSSGLAAEYARVLDQYPADLINETLNYMIPNEVMRPGPAILKRYLEQAFDAQKEAEHNKIKRESPSNLDHCSKSPHGKRCLELFKMAGKGEYGNKEFNAKVESLIRAFPEQKQEWEEVLIDVINFNQEKKRAQVFNAEMEGK